MIRSRCCECYNEFDGRGEICPKCKRMEDAAMLVATTMPAPPFGEPFRWSRAAMRERLGVNGDYDS